MSDAAARLALFRKAIVGISGDPTWEETVVGLDTRIEEAEKLLKKALPLLLTFKYSIPKSERDAKAIASQIEGFLRRQGR